MIDSILRIYSSLLLFLRLFISILFTNEKLPVRIPLCLNGYKPVVDIVIFNHKKRVNYYNSH
jgi:hypothetical protein